MVQEFAEGEEYELSDLPDSDMTNSGKLELVGNGELAAVFGDQYVTFEWSKVRCTDVTNTVDL